MEKNSGLSEKNQGLSIFRGLRPDACPWKMFSWSPACTLLFLFTVNYRLIFLKQKNALVNNTFDKGHIQKKVSQWPPRFRVFQRSTFVGSAWSFVFSSLPQWPMTSNFEGFSIPDFIHYSYIPILILDFLISLINTLLSIKIVNMLCL